MEPVYFGKDGSLFGFYHPASNGIASGNVLLCAPLFVEYFRAYQIQKELAFALSEAGYDVLRFDYRGSGDSRHDLSEFRLKNWQQDIRDAADELAALSGQERLVVVGIRLGAGLAMKAFERILPHGFVLWDPVFEGSVYLSQLKKMEQGLAREYQISFGSTPPAALKSELSGYEVHPLLQADLIALHIDAVAYQEQCCTRVLQSANSGPIQAEIQAESVPFECEWTNSAGPLLFAHQLVEHLVGAVNEVSR